MIVILVALFAMSSFLLFSALLQMLFLSNKRMEKRLNRYLDLNDKKQLSRKKFNLLVRMQLYKRTVRERVLTKQRSSRLDAMLRLSGVPLKPEEYVLFQWMSTALCAGIFYLLFNQPLMLGVGAVIGFLLPRWWIGKKRKARIKAFNDGLLDMLTTVISSLRAGFSFAQALKTVVDESDGPVQEEAETVLKEMQYGTTMEDALTEWKERMPSEDLDLMIQAILIQRQIGGNLAVILETIVQTIRDRGRIQRQVTTLTAQGKLSGIVIGLLPFVLAFLLYLISPDYIGTLFQNKIGIGLVAGGLVSGIIGFILIRKITTIEV
ncbi:type II secretion system F family protein [Cohnella lubricantis]|uniref:Type II secretion system F family protein n=1 Tax=Cohnella lubricantis TaxID=2163172 RepID=A0A841TE14_9BACL|nr:type II secretion system F family protein [Cohnella lubricantis]MBB6679524.1 type II secretion system F family protein [Cohnella lubricantis]MBP2119256.1 tight adherence protein B [Cohnella lubricantis]